MAFAQESGRSTISIGAGGGFAAGGYRTEGIPDSAAFSGAYEFRLLRYLAAEAGAVNSIPNVVYSSKYGPYSIRERVTLGTFGLRGVLPLAHGRAEVIAGVGAGYLWSSDPELTVLGYQSPRWLPTINGGGRVALDHHHRFWLGPTVRFTRDVGRPTEQSGYRSPAIWASGSNAPSRMLSAASRTSLQGIPASPASRLQPS